MPVIHKPHWQWLIITYFFLGGIAGGSYVLASLAELSAARRGGASRRAGRFVSLAALLPCPLLLILDLGRPERFLNMLRVLKLRSPMSIGTWGLTAFGGFCALSALGEAARAGLLGEHTAPARLGRRVPSRAVGVLGTLPAFFVSGYTGVLLAATAVPLWTKNYLLLGPALPDLGGLQQRGGDRARRWRACAAPAAKRSRGWSGSTRSRLIAELGLLVAVRANLGRRLGRPLRHGRLGLLHRLMVGLGLLAPLALQGRALLRREPPSRGEAAAGLAVCARGRVSAALRDGDGRARLGRRPARHVRAHAGLRLA